MKHAKNIGRVLSLLLVLTMLVGALAAFAVTGSAAIVAPVDGAEIWDGTVATEYAGGTGTEADPYQIATPGQFAYFRNTEAVNATADTYYVLTADLWMNGEKYTNTFTAVAPAFAGVFDGKGYTIYNPNIDIAKGALFGDVSGEIKNLNVDGLRSVTGTWNTNMGGVVYTLSGSMDNVHVTNGDVAAGKAGGGLVCQTSGAVTVTINNCSYQGTLRQVNATDNGSGWGGIVGVGATVNSHTLEITNCYVNVVGTFTTTARNRIGGILGTIGPEWVSGAPKSTAVTIENCVAEGTITHTGATTNASTGIGGIVGLTSEYVRNVTLKDCVNKVNMACGNQKYVGGLVGSFGCGTAMTVTNCANYGTIAGENAGGLFGRVANKAPVVSNCANYGAVSGTTAMGAIVGELGQNMTLNGGVYCVAADNAATLLFGNNTKTVTATNVAVVDGAGSTYKDVVNGITVHPNGVDGTALASANTYAFNNGYMPWVQGETAPELLATNLKLNGANLELTSNLTMNFRMDANLLPVAPAGVDANVAVKLVAGDSVYEGERDGNYYVFAVNDIAAADMGEDRDYYIVVEITTGGVTTSHKALTGKTYSPVTYAQNISAREDEDAVKAQDLLDALVTYAYWAQILEDGASTILDDYNAATGKSLSSNSITYISLARDDVSASALRGYVTVGANLGSGVNLVFKVNDGADVASLTLVAGGTTKTYNAVDGYIEITDVHAGMLKNKLEITLNNAAGDAVATGTYSVANYLDSVSEATLTDDLTWQTKFAARAAAMYMLAVGQYQTPAYYNVEGLESTTYYVADYQEVTDSYTFEENQFTEEQTTVSLNGVNWTVDGANAYDYNADLGQAFGADEYVVLSTDHYEQVNTVKVTASTAGVATFALRSAGATLEVYVGGIQVGETITLTDVATEYEFVVPAGVSGTLEIRVTATVLFIKTIEVNGVKGEGAPQPATHEHNYNATVTAPTCTAGGYTTYTCECGDTYTGNAVDALDHDYQGATCETRGTCVNGCGEQGGELADHTWVDATFYAPKTCSVCGATEGEALVAEAQIGETKYATLEEAVAQGGEVVLLIDVELDAPLVVTGNVTIDLNGNKISYTNTEMNVSMITNRGTLVINDSIGGGEIYYNYTGEADATYGKGNYTITNCGTLTINGGKISIADLRQHAKYPINNVSGSSDAIFVMNGGHLYNYNTAAIRMLCSSTTYKNSVTINGGLVEGYSAIWMQNPGSNTVKGDLTITGGEIKTTAAAYANGTAGVKDVSSKMYPSISTESGAWSEDSFISITGGIFNENVKLDENAPANVTIGDGATFNGNLLLPVTHEHNYNEEVTAPTCTAAGYTTYTCECGDTYTGNAVDALDHDYQGATCETLGTCVNGCGEQGGELADHTWVDATCEAPETCSVCGATEGEALGHDWQGATCTQAAVCANNCGTEGTTAPHNYVDGECSYGCGWAEGGSAEVNLSFANTDYRTELSTTQQVWEQNGIIVIINKGNSTSNVADYSNPVRIYKNHVVTVEFAGMTKIVFNCNTADYATDLGTAIEDAVVDGNTVTIIFAQPTDSFNFNNSEAQVRVDSIDVYAEVSEHEHAYSEATCTAPATCSVCGKTTGEALGHDYDEVVTSPTCTEKGYTTYTCATCGDIYTGNEVEATGHNYVDGKCECGAKQSTTPAEPTVKLEITKEDFNSTSYAANNNTKTEGNYSYTSNQVMNQQSTMQWQKNAGYITIDSNSFTKLEIKVTAGTFTVTVGGKTVTGTTVGGVTTYDLTGLTGAVKISVGSATGKVEYLKFYA